MSFFTHWKLEKKKLCLQYRVKSCLKSLTLLLKAFVVYQIDPSSKFFMKTATIIIPQNTHIGTFFFYYMKHLCISIINVNSWFGLIKNMNALQILVSSVNMLTVLLVPCINFTQGELFKSVCYFLRLTQTMAQQTNISFILIINMK